MQPGFLIDSGKSLQEPDISSSDSCFHTVVFSEVSLAVYEFSRLLSFYNKHNPSTLNLVPLPITSSRIQQNNTTRFCLSFNPPNTFLPSCQASFDLRHLLLISNLN